MFCFAVHTFPIIVIISSQTNIFNMNLLQNPSINNKLLRTLFLLLKTIAINFFPHYLFQILYSVNYGYSNMIYHRF